MPVKQKNPQAGVFNEQARAKRAELLDTTKTLTMEQVTALTAEISALEARAAAAAGFTAAEEIADQGGDEALGGSIRGTPENSDGAADPQYSGLYDANGVRQSRRRRMSPVTREALQLAKRVDEEFGGPNSLLVALSKHNRNASKFTAKQQRVVDDLTSFAKRTIVSDANDTSGAEFLLPLQQESSIFRVDNTVLGIVQTARRYNVRGRSLRIPYLKQTYDGNTRPMAGIANVDYVEEGETKPIREVSFAQRLMVVYKVAAYAEVGDESLDDDMTGDLAPVLQESVGGQVVNFLNEEATYDGSGTTRILGAFNASNPSLIAVERETSNHITFNDFVNLLARHLIGPNSRFFVTPSGLSDVLTMTLNGNNTLVTMITDMRNMPQLQVLGVPVIVTPLAPVLGTQGDLALGNGDFYAYGLRQGLTVQSSTDYKFREDITAYRFVSRAGGIPIPDGTYSYKAPGSAKEWAMSPFVVLDDTQAS